MHIKKDLSKKENNTKKINLKSKSWITILLCISMILSNLVPAFSDEININNEIEKMEEVRNDAIEEIHNEILDINEEGSEEIVEEIIEEELDKNDGNSEISQEIEEEVNDEEENTESTAYDEGYDEDYDINNENIEEENCEDIDEDFYEEIDDEVEENNNIYEGPVVNLDLENIEPTSPYEEIEEDFIYEEEPEEDIIEEEPEDIIEEEPDEDIEEIYSTPSDLEEYNEDEEIYDEEFEENLYEELATYSELDEETEEEMGEFATVSEIEETGDNATPSEIEDVIEEKATPSDIEEEIIGEPISTPSRPRMFMSPLFMAPLMAPPAPEPIVAVLHSPFNSVFSEADFSNIKEIEIHDSTTSTPLPYAADEDKFEYGVIGDKLIIRSRGDRLIINGEQLFYDLNNVEKIGFYGENYDAPTKIDQDQTECVNYFNMFGDCTSLKEIVNLNKIISNQAERFNFMFIGCESLESVDLSNINMSNVESTDTMFANCKSLKNIDFSGKDLSEVTEMYNMFSNCESLESVDFSNVDFTNEDFFNEIDMSGMFNGCVSLKNVDFSNADILNVTNMSDMFNGCASLENINFQNANNPNVTKTSSMFLNCESLQYIDISNFYFTNVTDCKFMFYNCKNLETIVANQMDTLYTEDEMKSANMFFDCDKLTGGNGTKYNMDYDPLTYDEGKYACIDCFDRVGYFTDLNNTYKISREMGVTISTFSVYRCGQNPTEDQYEIDRVGKRQQIQLRIVPVEGFKVDSVDIEVAGSTVGSAESYGLHENPYKFYEYKYAMPDDGFNPGDMIVLKINTSASENLGFWYVTDESGNEGEASIDTYNVLHITDQMKDIVSNKSGRFMFGDIYFGSTNLNNKIKKVVFDTDMSPISTKNLFYNMTKIEEIDNIDKLDTQNVTDMSRMFFMCNSLKNINLSNFDTEDVTDMSYMFNDCDSIEKLDISNFNFENIQKCNGMFQSSNKLESIIVSDDSLFNKNPESANMLSDCPSLVGGNGTRYDQNYTNDINFARIDNSANIGYFTDKNDSYKIIKDINNNIASMSIYRSVEGQSTDYEVNKCASNAYEEIIVTPKLGYVSNNILIIVGGEIENIIIPERIDDMFNPPKYVYYYSVGSYPSYDEITIKANIELSNNSGFWYVTDASGNIGESSIDNYNILHLTTTPQDEIYKTSGLFMFGETSFLNALICSDIKKVVFDDEFSPNTTEFLFYGLTKITEIENLDKLNTENVIEMSRMFMNCYSLESLDLHTFDTTYVSDMSYLVSYCESLVDIDISGFNYEHILYCNGMFQECRNLETIIAADDSLYEKHPSSDNMFQNCESLVGGYGTTYSSGNNDINFARIDSEMIHGYFTSINEMHSGPSILQAGFQTDYNINWDNIKEVEIHDSPSPTPLPYRTRNKKFEYEVLNGNKLIIRSLGEGLIIEGNELFYVDMYSPFDEIEKIGFYDANMNPPTNVKLDQVQNKNFSKMFMNCNSLSEIENLTCILPNDITDMSDMFNYCYGFESFSLEGFNTSNVTSMKQMFKSCFRMTEFDFANVNLSNVTDMEGFFRNCSSLEEIDLYGIDFSNVSNIDWMFYGCDYLTTIYADNNTLFSWNVGKGSLMFMTDHNLIGGNGTGFKNVSDYDFYADLARYARIDKVGEPGYFTEKNKTHMIIKNENHEGLKIYRSGVGSTTYEVDRCVGGQEIKIDCGNPNIMDPNGIILYEKNNQANTVSISTVSENRYVIFTMPDINTVGDVCIDSKFEIKKLINGSESGTEGTYDLSNVGDTPFGTEVTISNIAPSSGKILKNVIVKYTNAPYTNINCTKVGDDYKFIMPKAYVSVNVEFENIYNINLPASLQNGTIVSDKTESAKDKIINLTCNPDLGYEIDEDSFNITTNPGGDNVNLTKVSNNNYKFTMPDSDVDVNISYQYKNCVIHIDSSHCTVVKNMDSGHINEIASISITSFDANYEFDSISIYYNNNGRVNISYNEVGENTYTFTIPGYDVYVKINNRYTGSNSGGSGGGSGGSGGGGGRGFGRSIGLEHGNRPQYEFVFMEIVDPNLMQYVITPGIHDNKANIFYKYDGSVIRSQWINVYDNNYLRNNIFKTDWYYATETGIAYNGGLKLIKGDYYLFDIWGKMLTGMQETQYGFRYFESAKVPNEGAMEGDLLQ